VNEFRNATELPLTESTHFFSMEQPELVAMVPAYAEKAL